MYQVGEARVHGHRHGACSAVKEPGDNELASLGLQCEMSLALTLGVPKSKVIE